MNGEGDFSSLRISVLNVLTLVTLGILATLAHLFDCLWQSQSLSVLS